MSSFTSADDGQLMLLMRGGSGPTGSTRTVVESSSRPTELRTVSRTVFVPSELKRVR